MMIPKDVSAIRGTEYFNRCLKRGMARFFFDVVFLVFSLGYLPTFLKKIRQAEDRGELVRQRLGILPKNLGEKICGRKIIWIHAVSVGEVMAVRQFLEGFVSRFQDFHVVLTTVTPTGQKVARQLEGPRVSVCYYPFDWAFAVRRFFRFLKPQAIFLVETEIWPNLILRASEENVPVGILNGRLSSRSFKRYRALKFLFGFLFSSLDFVLTQSEDDARRFVSMGASEGRVRAIGNMKFDNVSLRAVDSSGRETLLREWGVPESCRLLIGGSTHPGEETLLLSVFLKLRKAFPSLKMILAPRHVERSAEVYTLVVGSGLRGLLSTERKKTSDFDVMILNQLGILKQLYAMADAAFVGGSLVRHGGQNPIEPAALRCPVVHGPYTFNFNEIYQALDRAEGARMVRDEKDLLEALTALLNHDPQRNRMAESAYEVVRNLQGATEAHLNWIQTFLTEQHQERIRNVVFDEKLFSATGGGK